MEGLRPDPGLPPDWTECGITKKFRDCIYEMTYRQAKKDGTIIDGTLLPYCSGAHYRVEVVG